MKRVERIASAGATDDIANAIKRMIDEAGECGYCGDELRSGQCSRACPASRRDAERRVDRRG